jgi:cytochrome c-type biogenesis protein CcmE
MNVALQRKLGAIAAIGTVAAVLGWLSFGTMGEDLVYYWSPAELIGKGDAARDATVRLGGLVEAGSVEWDPNAQRLAFRLTDGKASVPCVGQGAPPQMFREGIGAVVEGRMDGEGVFRTSNVLIKHSNEYRAPTEGERPQDMYKSLMPPEGT